MMTYQKNIILFGIKSASDSKSVCNKEFLKTKRKSHGDKDTYIYDKKISKVDSNHTCLAEASLDSGLRKDRNYYLKVFLNVTHSHCLNVMVHGRQIVFGKSIFFYFPMFQVLYYGYSYVSYDTF